MNRIFSNIHKVLKEPKYLTTALVTAAAFEAVYLLLLGVYRIPIIEFGVNRMSPVLFGDYLFTGVVSVMTGLIVATYRYKVNYMASATGESAAGSGGLFAGVLSAVCPVCQGLTFAVAGAPIAFLNLGFLVPYITEIRVASIALLSVGLLFLAKDLHACTLCKVPVQKAKKGAGIFDVIDKPPYSHALYALIAVALIATGLQAAVVLGSVNGASHAVLPTGSSGNGKINLAEVTAEVVPKEGFTIDAEWGTVVNDMVDTGALDPAKLEDLITKRYGQEMKPEWKRLLTDPRSNEKLHIDSENAVYMMYLLWVLGKHNDNAIVHDSEFAQYFQDYDIGVGRVGYGDTRLLTLTAEQQQIAKNVAEGTYRPCCGNPTAWPDCSHGFALLGLIELMASRGYSEDEIYDAALQFNSVWFPAHYIQAAAYFELKEGQSWDQVDPKVVMGKDYSTLQGSRRIQRELQALGV